VQVPFMFKYAVDALSAAAGATGATAAASAATSSLLFARAGASACNGKRSSKNGSLFAVQLQKPGLEWTQSSRVKHYKSLGIGTQSLNCSSVDCCACNTYSFERHCTFLDFHTFQF
jgi:hypothetical protein